MHGVFWVSSHSMCLINTLSSPAPLKAHGWGGKKKSCLKPIHIPADPIFSIPPFSHSCDLYISLSSKKESCVLRKEPAQRGCILLYTNPPNALLPTYTRHTTLNSTPCFVFTYPPIGLTSIETLYTSCQIIYLSTTIC